MLTTTSLTNLVIVFTFSIESSSTYTLTISSVPEGLAKDLDPGYLATISLMASYISLGSKIVSSVSLTLILVLSLITTVEFKHFLSVYKANQSFLE